MQKVEAAINEGWKLNVVNKERKRWTGVNSEIEIREWTEYYKGLK